ncbi:MAG: hypothetical protein IT426_16820 [Pirellulales bacterium]|nr:hypothetical protein [Pirellulales bacterium]
MTIRGKTTQWDELLSAIDEWEAEVKPSLETLHFVHEEDTAGYSVPSSRFMLRYHKIRKGCDFMAPEIDIHPLTDLSAELCHPENPPRPHYREWIRDLWAKCERILERLRAEGGIVEKIESAQKTKRSEPKVFTQALMVDLIAKKAECHTWSARKFAEVLKRGEGTIKETDAWRSLVIARESARLKRAEKKQEQWQRKGKKPTD